MGGSVRHRRQSKRKKKGTKRARSILVRREMDRLKPFRPDLEISDED